MLDIDSTNSNSLPSEQICSSNYFKPYKFSRGPLFCVIMAILEKRGGPFALTFSIFRFWRYLKQNRGVWISGRLVGWGPKMAGSKIQLRGFREFREKRNIYHTLDGF